MTSYLQIPEIPGDSTDVNHKGWIEILSFRTEKRQAGQGASAPDERTAWIQKLPDSASAVLRETKYVEFASIVIDHVEPKGIERITLLDVRLRTVNSRAVGDGPSVRFGEELQFDYARAQYGQIEPLPAGRSAGTSAPPSLFLNLPGISGTATAVGHERWIEFKRILRFRPDHPSMVREHLDGRTRRPVLLRSPESEQGVLTVLMYRDAASQSLQRASPDHTFEWLVIDVLGVGWSQRMRLQKVHILGWRSVGADEAAQIRTDPAGDEVDFAFEQAASEPAPAAKSRAHAVARAHSAAATEHTVVNLRPPRFFEIALPVLMGPGGRRIYPPAEAILRLVSQRGYDRSLPVSEGVVTEDGFCSFRFHEIAEKSTDELFTATLESKGETETIFKDRPVATYIRAARKTGPYEPVFFSDETGPLTPGAPK